MKELFNKKIVKVTGRNPITKEPIEIEKEIWSWNELEFYCNEDDLRALSKVELTDEEFNLIVRDFNVLLNNSECKDLLDDEERKMIAYALKNIDNEECRIYLLVEEISILDDLFYDGIVYEMAKNDIEKSLFKKLMEALTDEEIYV
ncbi:hypothetical protein [Clostridium sp.]|uniref:hypothetical protein n=1 Tax=Clostridium sp. TaxID=1506 RepID=UPI001DA27E98|nr:hypothetical protein [Clostridium sp.]MBS5937746.1 hypothetical protein [Clostridium sp.]